MNRAKSLTALALSCFLTSSFAVADNHEKSSAQGRIILYSSSKAAWPNGSYMCALPTNRVWIRNLHDKSTKGIFGRRCKGDKARHLAIVGPMSAGTNIQVFNNRGGSTTKPGDSSYALMHLRQDIRAGQTLIVGSFEGSQSNALFGIRSFCNMRKDGRRYCPFRDGSYLDGKVSYIRVLPPRTAEHEEFTMEPAEDEVNRPNLDEFSDSQ